MRRFGIVLVLVLVLGILAAGCISKPPETTPPPTTTKPPVVTTTPTPKPAVYEGTLYVAGMGGHFAKAEVKIDPSNADSPIALTSALKRVVLGDKKIYATHDPRIDAKNKNIMYWSTYVNDSGYAHVGKTDLSTGQIVIDTKVDISEAKKGPMYCGSGQSENEFLPVFMGYIGWVDVIDKATMQKKARVILKGGDIPTSYTFPHGVSSPDMKSMYVWMGESAPDKAGAFPRGNLNLHVFKLDTASLVKGELKILQKASVVGGEGTVFFRGYMTKDGKYLLVSGRDRAYVFDSDLKVVDEEMMQSTKIGEKSVLHENHDFMPTPDGKYALLTLRVPYDDGKGAAIYDGQVQLYDMTKKAAVGKPVSTCKTCHDTVDIKGSAILCGEDAVWK